MNLKLEEALLNLEKAALNISGIEGADEDLLNIRDKIEGVREMVYIYKEGEEETKNKKVDELYIALDIVNELVKTDCESKDEIRKAIRKLEDE